MKITISGIFRNSEVYCYWLIKQLKQMETYYSRRIDLNYAFYENDSIDNTTQILTDFMSTRIDRGRFISEHLGTSFINRYHKELANTNIRTIRLAECRNRCFDGLHPLDSEWTLIIDSDIYFPINILDKFLEEYENLRSDKIAMLLANGLNSDGYYYDEWAFRDVSGHRCNKGLLQHRFERIDIFCLNEKDRHNWVIGKPVKVMSGFGGCGFVRSNLLEHSRWTTPKECEHIEFCKNLREHGDIYICPNIICHNFE